MVVNYKKANWIILFVLFLVIFDIFIWKEILFNAPNANPELYFLDVGQGDSELVVLAGGVKVLIDAGPGNKILSGMELIFSPFKRYVDVAVISHSQTDHFAGLIDVLKRYQVGIFIFNGQKGTSRAFGELEKSLREKGVLTMVLVEGDKIRHQDDYFQILSPSGNFSVSSDLNDGSLVMKAVIQGVEVLFTGDIGASVEKQLLEKYDLDVDILKVGHHGSKFSSSAEFLNEISPQLAIIEVGKNSYGHPTKEVLNNLASVNARVFRTDIDGTVKIVIGENRSVGIFKEKFEF